jgi:hypothetical protein
MWEGTEPEKLAKKLEAVPRILHLVTERVDHSPL